MGERVGVRGVLTGSEVGATLTGRVALADHDRVDVADGALAFVHSAHRRHHRVHEVAEVIVRAVDTQEYKLVLHHEGVGLVVERYVFAVIH